MAFLQARLPCERECGLTLRSSGPPPAWHLGREASQLILRLAAQAPTRRGPLSSNVRRHMPTSSALSANNRRSPAEWLAAAIATLVIVGGGYSFFFNPVEPTSIEDLRYLQDEFNRLSSGTSTAGSWSSPRTISRTYVLLQSSFQASLPSDTAVELLAASLRSLKWQPHHAETKGSLSEFCKGRFRAILEIHQAQLLLTMRVKEFASQEVCKE